jgi:hypothetical protein
MSSRQVAAEVAFPRSGRPGRTAHGREGVPAGTRKDANRMRKVVLWGGLPAAVAGVALWFMLVPGRSGAG